MGVTATATTEAKIATTTAATDNGEEAAAATIRPKAGDATATTEKSTQPTATIEKSTTATTGATTAATTSSTTESTTSAAVLRFDRRRAAAAHGVPFVAEHTPRRIFVARTRESDAGARVHEADRRLVEIALVGQRRRR
jgi:hypothetical protein